MRRYKKAKVYSQMALVLGVGLLITGLVAGVSISGSARELAYLFDPDLRVLFLEREQAAQGMRIASAAVGGLVKMGVWVSAGIALSVSLVGLSLHLVRWARVQALLVRPRAGLYPVRDGVDYNSALALEVQRAAALASGGGDFSVKYTVGDITGDGEALARQAVWPTRVDLRSLLEGPPSLERLVLGVTVDEVTGATSTVTASMASLVHIAVGASVGWGKSIFERVLVWQLLHAVEAVDLVLIDLEGVTFSPFGSSERLLYPIADTEQDATAVLKEVLGEVEKRKELYSQYPGVDRLDRYNQKAKKRLHPLVFVMDEATSLLGDKSVESALKTVVLRGRKYGIWGVLAGQDWKASTLDSAIRHQLVTRLQFKAMSSSQSRVLLGQVGAEDLAVPGRGLLLLPGREVLKVHTPYVDIGNGLLEGTGPRRQFPQEEGGEVSSAQVKQIKALLGQGLAQSAVEKAVFSYTGGAAYRAVKAVVEEVG